MTNLHTRPHIGLALIGAFLGLVPVQAQEQSILLSEAHAGFDFAYARSLELVYLVPADGDGRTKCTIAAADNTLGGPSAIQQVSGEARWRVVATDCPNGPGACSELRTLARGAERWETNEDREATFNLVIGRQRIQRELGANSSAYLVIKIDRIALTENDTDSSWTCSTPNNFCYLGASCRSFDRLEFE